VLRGLVSEAGWLLHPKELTRTTSYWMMLPLWNVVSLMASPSGYRSSRKKQLALIELAFLKHRKSRGEDGAAIEQRERSLRHAILQANQAGIFIGPR